MTRGEVAQVLAEVHRLPAGEQTVVRLRFGLGGGPMLSHKQVSEHVGRPVSDVRVIERNALDRLAATMTPHGRLV